MAEEKVLKPKTFRIDEETAEKIRTIAETIGGNQQEAFTKLIETYELQSSKSILPDQRTNIEQFEKYTNALTHLYLVSLETSQSAEETIRIEFDALLKSKDVTIQNLQEQLFAAKKLEEDSIKKAESLVRVLEELKSSFTTKESDYATQITNLHSMLADKDSLNKALSDSYAEEKQKISSLSEKIGSLVQKNKELSSIGAELSSVKAERDQLLSSKEDLEKELQSAVALQEYALSDLKQQHSFVLEQCKQQAQLEQEKTVLSIERKYQEQIQALKEQRQVEVDGYQQKYFALLEKLEEKKVLVPENLPLDSGQ